ncbi:MAG: response regulator [Lachnospiraceae bacterium]|nr:response regulator [Lachnospiraceae bacterium]
MAACILLAVMLTGLFSVPAAAENEPVTLRVAFNPLEGFFEYDKKGHETGYGVDLLNKITQYSGIRFEYVKADTWEETKSMLLSGEADIRMPGTMPQTPSTTLGYTSNSIFYTSHVLMTLKSRDDLYYEDYENAHNLKIGITEDMYANLSYDGQKFGTFAESFGFGDENLVYYDTYNDERAALDAGEIDAVISNIVDMRSDMKLLLRFDSSPNYISMTKGNPYLEGIDSVLAQILDEDPEYLNNLNKYWFPHLNSIPLTKEETEYVNGLGGLTFAFHGSKGYLSMQQSDGTYTGFYPDMAAFISDKLGVPCHQITAGEEGEADIVIYPDYYFDYKYADENQINITLPYLTARYYEISKRNAVIDETTCRVAAVRDQRVTQDYIADGYTEEQMVWYNNDAECIRAVENGDADIAFANSYVAEYYLAMYRYIDLRYSLTKYSHQVSFGVMNDGDGMITTVLNKMLDSVSEVELDRLVTNSMNSYPGEDILQEWVISNPTHAFAIAGVMGALAIAVILVIIFAKRTRKQNVKLQKATAAKSDFLSRMSHDMRTPLNVIMGMNKLAQENDNPPDTKECLEKIDISSEFLLGLINDVLDMERVENGRLELHLFPYAQSDFTNYINTIIRPLCEQKNIQLDYWCEYSEEDSKEFVVMQDKLKINQIYFNLLSNAVKYTQENGHITFYIQAEEKPDGKLAMHVTISDNGIGMSKEFQQHMFEPFSQENQVVTSVSQGSGLGLAIVKRMCDLMGMTISVESELGKGTTYRLYGEYTLVQSQEEQKAEEIKKETKKDYSVLAGKMVLVCEDHMLNQEIIRRLLEKQKIIVDLAEDGKMGVEKFSKSAIGTYDMILMDIRMPVLDGLEATRAIRESEREDAKTVPIIAMTANAYKEDVNRSLDAGMNEHLAKPIEPEVLYETLVKYINKENDRNNIEREPS